MFHVHTNHYVLYLYMYMYIQIWCTVFNNQLHVHVHVETCLRYCTFCLEYSVSLVRIPPEATLIFYFSIALGVFLSFFLSFFPDNIMYILSSCISFDHHALYIHVYVLKSHAQIFYPATIGLSVIYYICTNYKTYMYTHTSKLINREEHWELWLLIFI